MVTTNSYIYFLLIDCYAGADSLWLHFGHILLWSGFPAAYLTGLQQPMYGYTGVGAAAAAAAAAAGLGGQQLEDLAALQRSTLASLPQLVGTAGSQLASAKAVR